MPFITDWMSVPRCAPAWRGPRGDTGWGEEVRRGCPEVAAPATWRNQPTAPGTGPTASESACLCVRVSSEPPLCSLGQKAQEPREHLALPAGKKHVHIPNISLVVRRVAGTNQSLSLQSASQAHLRSTYCIKELRWLLCVGKGRTTLGAVSPWGKQARLKDSQGRTRGWCTHRLPWAGQWPLGLGSVEGTGGRAEIYSAERWSWGEGRLGRHRGDPQGGPACREDPEVGK